ncbi:MAG: hypothetical protein ABIH35_02645 [Patescibacteria group bacterium]
MADQALDNESSDLPKKPGKSLREQEEELEVRLASDAQTLLCVGSSRNEEDSQDSGEPESDGGKREEKLEKEPAGEHCLSIGNTELDIGGGDIKLTYLWEDSFIDLKGDPHFVLQVKLATGGFKEYTLPLRELINQPILIKIGKKQFQIIPRKYEIDREFIDALHFGIEFPSPRGLLRKGFKKLFKKSGD